MGATGSDFTDYVDAHWQRLVRSAVLLGCPVAEAEDLVQTALVRCHRSWSRVARAEDPDAYVHRVLINAWRKSRRRRWWGETPSGGRDDLDAGAEPGPDRAVAERDLVLRTLRGLSEQHREVLVLRYYADLSERQVADLLGVAPGTVKSRTSRALAQVAEQLDLQGMREETP